MSGITKKLKKLFTKKKSLDFDRIIGKIMNCPIKAPPPTRRRKPETPPPKPPRSRRTDNPPPKPPRLNILSQSGEGRRKRRRRRMRLRRRRKNTRKTNLLN